MPNRPPTPFDPAGKAYETLRDYQLFSKEGGDLTKVYEIEARYEKFEHLVLNPNLNLVKKIKSVLEACKTIEAAIQEAAEQAEAQRQRIEEIYKDAHPDYVAKRRKDDEEYEKLIISEVGKPLPYLDPNEFPEEKVFNELYKKHGLRTHKQKKRLIEHLMHEYHGATKEERKQGYAICARGLWREPKWKLRQFDLRALQQIYWIQVLEPEQKRKEWAEEDRNKH